MQSTQTQCWFWGPNRLYSYDVFAVGGGKRSDLGPQHLPGTWSSAGTGGTNTSMEAHFREETFLKVAPWRSTLQLIPHELAALAQFDRPALQREFAETAKAGQLGPDEAALLHALLFFEEKERYSMRWP